MENDSDDSAADQYVLTQSAPRQPTVSDKKRLDLDNFQAWLHASQTERSRRKQRASTARTQSAADRLHETGHENACRIIDSPREYQLELFERAKQKNIIVVLDTGSGKTLISVLLMRHVLDAEVERRASSPDACPEIAFFVVEKVALCLQQYNVLEKNIDHSVGVVHGDVQDTGRRDFWQRQLSENKAIVITAQVLLDCLHNGFVTMRHINLLVFDEAHHAKKHHPFARILKSHYLREPDETQRPKILGMTASPVDAQTRDLRGAAAELESIMCSEIATVSDEVLRNAPRAIETYDKYDRLLPKEETRTSLWEMISNLVSDSLFFRAALDFTQEASSTIGPQAADLFWSLLVTDSEVTKLVAKTEGDLGNQSVDFVDQAIRAVHQVRSVVQDEPSLQFEKDQLSSKFKLLLDVLQEQYDRGASRCIVFVDKRYTAILLSTLLRRQEISVPGVVPAYLVGSQTATAKSSGIATMTFKEQIDALRDFKDGNTNCLFSTTVAEEGIDIPACDVVIRWDMYSSMIQYVQSRGRARQRGSRFVSLIEDGNFTHARLCKQAQRDSTALRQFCSALPEDRKVQDPLVVDAAALAIAEEASQQSLDISSTGARLTYDNCLEVLARFVSSLQGPSDATFAPEFGVMPMGGSFRAHIILPEVSPLTYMSGHPQRSKRLARRSAAFEACVSLHNDKHIDDNLQSTLAKRLPAYRNARIGLSSQKKQQYKMRIKPDFWASTDPAGVLWATVLMLDNPTVLGASRAIESIALLTRQPLPDLPKIPLYFGNGHSSSARPVPVDDNFTVTGEQLETLHGFTLKLFDDVFSKQFNAEASDMPYFLAPVLRIGEDGCLVLDWDIMRQCQVDSFLDWEGQAPDFYVDKFVVDSFDGGRKMITLGINPSLKPSDHPPAHAPAPKSRAYRLVEPSIKEYSNSYFAAKRQAWANEWREDQPVVDAELMSLRRNFLDDAFVDEARSNNCSIILQPLKVSPIPIGILLMVNLFPSIIHRIDQILIALEACDVVGLKGIQPSLALEACTKDSDKSEEHDEQQVNFQAGMGNNYERLEFLGDSFLKMATTISIFTIKSSMKEFEAHTARMLQIANRNLFNHAVDRGLQEYVRSKSFDRRLWYPNLPLKKGKAPKTEVSHSLSDKSIADVCEALIGAAYLSDNQMDLAVRAVAKMVRSENHPMKTWGAYYAAYESPAWANGPVTQVQRDVVSAVSHKVGYTFKSPALLRSAFKHPSYTADSIPDYQRLEFLGDGLLDMVVVEHLFRRYPLADPQWLTEHKMAIVSNQFLGCLCVKLGVHKHILTTHAALITQRAEFATNLERAEAAATDDQGQCRRDFWRDAEQPPKALADAVESLIGAMFVDAAYDYSIVQDFFTRHILPYFEDMALYDSYADKHPVTWMTRKLHDRGCNEWRLLSSEVPAALEKGAQSVTQAEVVCALLVHGKHFEDATAASGRYAKVACAKRAIRKLDGMDEEEFCKRTGCDCKAQDGISVSERAGVAV